MPSIMLFIADFENLPVFFYDDLQLHDNEAHDRADSAAQLPLIRRKQIDIIHIARFAFDAGLLERKTVDFLKIEID